MIVKFDDENKRTQVSLRAEDLLNIMDIREEEEGEKRSVLWRPEFAAYMIEGTPGSPYGDNMHGQGLLSNFNQVEPNMRLRRAEMKQLLDANECLLTLTSFPRLGCPNFSYPLREPNVKGVSGSIFFPDDAIYGGHPRFK